MPVSFVGPSYNLATRKADTQRVINLMPVINEVPSGKSLAYLESIPGLTTFSEPPGGPFSIRYFGIEPEVAPETTVPFGDALDARNAFLSDLINYAVEDCEGIANNTANPTLNFGGISCTTSGIISKTDPTDVRPQGRFNTTPSGISFLLTDGTAGVVGNPTVFTFASSIAAFGCYISDIADFGSQITVWAETDTGKVFYFGCPVTTTTVEAANSSLSFFGFIVRGFNIVKVTFIRDDCFGFNTTVNTDQIGFDDILVATSTQIKANPAGFPVPWPQLYGFETLFGLHFNALEPGTANRFPNAGAMGDPMYLAGGNQVEIAQDSAADSTADGTWVTDVSFDGKAYNCNGNRLSLTMPAFSGIGGYAFAFRYGFCVEFWFKRTGAIVGTGEIIYIPNLLELRYTGTFIQTSLTVDDGFAPFTIDQDGTTALALNTRTHVRFMVHNAFDASKIRSAIFRNGTMEADTEDTLYGTQCTIGTGTIGTIKVGGKDASNYTPGVIDEVVISSMPRGLFANYTTPADPFDEIYPPGMFPNPYPAE